MWVLDIQLWHINIYGKNHLKNDCKNENMNNLIKKKSNKSVTITNLFAKFLKDYVHFFVYPNNNLSRRNSAFLDIIRP